MNCFNCLSLTSAPSPSVYIHRYKHQIWPTIKPRTLQLNGNNFSSSPRALKTRALPPPIFLATAVPKAVKLSVLLQTGAVCLVAYWIANFVVPEMILKELQSEDTNDNGENSREDR